MDGPVSALRRVRKPDSRSSDPKLHFIERMVPLVEAQLQPFASSGPHGTGKSPICNGVSPTPSAFRRANDYTANLFGRLNASAKKSSSARAHGFGWKLRDVVAFDEVAGMHFKDMNASTDSQRYMTGGTARPWQGKLQRRCIDGVRETSTTACRTCSKRRTCSTRSHRVQRGSPSSTASAALPLPGWEVPKMRSVLTKRYGAHHPIA